MNMKWSRCHHIDKILLFLLKHSLCFNGGGKLLTRSIKAWILMELNEMSMPDTWRIIICRSATIEKPPPKSLKTSFLLTVCLWETIFELLPRKIPQNPLGDCGIMMSLHREGFWKFWGVLVRICPGTTLKGGGWRRCTRNGEEGDDEVNYPFSKSLSFWFSVFIPLNL